jgi:hypothetical protein
MAPRQRIRPATQLSMGVIVAIVVLALLVLLVVTEDDRRGQ